MCLLKTGACLIQVLFNVFAFCGHWIHACLIQGACLTEAATKTGFTLFFLKTVCWSRSLTCEEVDKKRKKPFIYFILIHGAQWLRVVECWTWDRGDAGSSLTGVTALCPWAGHINPCLVVWFKPGRPISTYVTEKVVDWDIFKSQIKQIF